MVLTWTEVNDLPEAADSLSGAGTQTAALSIGGGTPRTKVLEWN